MCYGVVRSYVSQTYIKHPSYFQFILVYVIYATAFDTVETTEKIKVVDDEGHTLDSTHRRNAMTIYTTSGTSKSGFAPLSIGFTLGFLCFLGGSVSGGAFNPARVFGAGMLLCGV